MKLLDKTKNTRLLLAFLGITAGCQGLEKTSPTQMNFTHESPSNESLGYPKKNPLIGPKNGQGSIAGQNDTIQPVLSIGNSKENPNYQLGSCKDDIYVSWLIEQYKASHPFTGKSKKERNSWEKDALTHAMTKLSHPPEIESKNALPLVNNPEVDRWIRHFKTTERSTLLQWLARGESLDDIMIPELQKQGVPREFFYLAMIESGFNTHAKSPMSAAGAWQIMPATGRLYELKINRFIDERKDPVKSSIAAAKLLRDLYQKFGDWYLAMAAYNAGPTLIEKAIKKGNTRDFWTLTEKSLLPKETSQYIPRWIAAYTLGSQPEKYGFHINDKTDSEIPSTYVELEKAYDLREIARSINLKTDTLKKWNPELLTGITPPVGRGKTYKLRLEEQVKKLLESKLDSLPFLDIQETFTYKITRGDTLKSIAKRHGVSLAEIIKLNPEIKPTNLRIGKAIYLPTT